MEDLEKQIEEAANNFQKERGSGYENIPSLIRELFITGAKSEAAKQYWQQEFPIEAIENLIGLINTPIGRRKYSQDITDQIKALSDWFEQNKKK